MPQTLNPQRTPNMIHTTAAITKLEQSIAHVTKNFGFTSAVELKSIIQSGDVFELAVNFSRRSFDLPTIVNTAIKLCRFNENVTAEQSYLLLWATNNHLPLAFEVAQAWGFEYKALHTWVKTTKVGDKIRFGVGHYGRNCTEHVLVCQKGNAPSWTALGLTDIPTAFQAPPAAHSKKL